MITILISENEKKIGEILARTLRAEGYDIPNVFYDGHVIQIAEKSGQNNVDSLKNIVLKLENSLYDEKRGAVYRAILEIVERPLLEHTLERTGGNQLKAARILGINRNTMRAKIRKLGIDVSRLRA